MSEEGSVCERGVVGRGLEVTLSSEVLLSWRASVLVSPMLSVSSERPSSSLDVSRAGAVATVGRVIASSMESAGGVGVCVALQTGVGPGCEEDVFMAFRRWTRSSCCGSSLGGKDTLGVMAASRVNT
jgi:hypothetical protein